MWSHGKAGDKLRDLALLAMLNPTDYELSLSFMPVPSGGPERLKIWCSWLRKALRPSLAKVPHQSLSNLCQRHQGRGKDEGDTLAAG